jgi:hypothetical protein
MNWNPNGSKDDRPMSRCGYGDLSDRSLLEFQKASSKTMSFLSRLETHRDPPSSQQSGIL